MRKSAVNKGRPPRKEAVERLSIYLPVSLAKKMRQLLNENRDGINSYVVRLIENDLNTRN